MSEIDLFGYLCCVVLLFIIFFDLLWKKYLRWLSFGDFLWGIKSFTCVHCHKKTRRRRWYDSDAWGMYHYSEYKCPKCKKWNHEDIIGW